MANTAGQDALATFFGFQAQGVPIRFGLVLASQSDLHPGDQKEKEKEKEGGLERAATAADVAALTHMARKRHKKKAANAFLSAVSRAPLPLSTTALVQLYDKAVSAGGWGIGSGYAAEAEALLLLASSTGAGGDGGGDGQEHVDFAQKALEYARSHGRPLL